MENILGIIGVFGMIPFIVFLGLFFKNKARKQNIELVQAMLDKDKEITPEIIRAVGFTSKRSHIDLRTGMILVAIGLATFIFAGIVPDNEAQSVFGGIAMFPLFIGIAYLGFWFLISRKDPE